MARLPQINQLKQSKAAKEAMQKPVEQTITPQSVAGGFQSMGEFKPQQPVLQKRNAQADYNATRSQALGHESNLADPEKAQKFWNASPYEYWTEQVKTNPESTYAIVNQMLASNETPEEKAKRERREALGETFRGLGNLIGNAANLYYATKGGTPIDLNTANEKHLERMQRIKDKQDALDEQRKQMIVNAKLSDVKTARAERAAKAKTDAEAAADELKYKRDLALKQIENAYKLGQIDAQTKAELAKQVAKFKSDKELEAFKQQGRVTLKGMKSGDSKAEEEKIGDSAIDSSGNIWTRASKMTDNELGQIAMSSPLYNRYKHNFTDSKTGQVDHRRMAAWLIAEKQIPSSTLEQMGFKQGKTSGKKTSLLPGQSTSLLPK